MPNLATAVSTAIVCGSLVGLPGIWTPVQAQDVDSGWAITPTLGEATVLLAGQSNASQLLDVPYPTTPLPNTFMLSGGQWVPPVNNIATLANELITKTGHPAIYVVPAAVGGSTLVSEFIDPNTGISRWWFNRSDPNAPLQKLKAMLTPDMNVMVAWWMQGETEATNGAVTETYQTSLVEIHRAIAAAAGKTPEKLPFLVSPLGPAGGTPLQAPLAFARNVLAAQYGVVKFPGMIVGPEWWDLPPDITGQHLTSAGYATLAIRVADAMAPIIGKASAAPIPSGCSTGAKVSPTMQTAGHGKPGRDCP